MINLVKGTITCNAMIISVASDYTHMNALGENRLVEKRNDLSGGAPYFYFETIEKDMRIGVTISMIKENVEWILLRWLDGPCTSKGWDDVSEKGLKDEYRTLINFVEKKAGRAPDSKKNWQCAWRFNWGQVKVSYEPRSFEVAIFLTPR